MSINVAILAKLIFRIIINLAIIIKKKYLQKYFTNFKINKKCFIVIKKLLHQKILYFK